MSDMVVENAKSLDRGLYFDSNKTFSILGFFKLMMYGELAEITWDKLLGSNLKALITFAYVLSAIKILSCETSIGPLTP